MLRFFGLHGLQGFGGRGRGFFASTTRSNAARRTARTRSNRPPIVSVSTTFAVKKPRS